MTLARPEKLPWVTIPLIVQLVFTLLGLLVLPFMGAIIPFIVPDAQSGFTTQDADTVRSIIGITTVVSGVFIVAWAAFVFFTLRAVQAGKSWGRVAAIVVFVLALLNFPFGTILGIFGLIGAFDPEVQRYISR